MKYKLEDFIHGLTELVIDLRQLSVTDVLLIVGVWVIVDFIHLYLKRYWIVKAQLYVNNLYRTKVLSYHVRNVLSSYKALASKEDINKAILKVRELEEELHVDGYDFTEAEYLYDSQIQIVHDRGYL